MELAKSVRDNAFVCANGMYAAQFSTFEIKINDLKTLKLW